MQLIERGQDLLNIIEYKLAVWALANFFEVYDRMTNSQQIKNIILIYCYQNQKKLLFKETKILRKLDHENNVKFLGTCKNTIILEFIDGNTLTNQYKNQFNRKLQKKTLNKFIIKLQKQSNTQLKKYIYHRDLKAYNIMIIDQQVKLIDFGLTSEINFVLLLWDSSLYRTRDISQKSYNEKKANIWALGESQYIKLFLGKFHFQAKMIKRLCQLKFLNSFYPNLSAENFKISYQISQIKIILKENYETYFIFLINLFYFLFNKIIIKSINISLKQKCNLKNIMLKIYQIIIIYLNFETSNCMILCLSYQIYKLFGFLNQKIFKKNRQIILKKNIFINLQINYCKNTCIRFWHIIQIFIKKRLKDQSENVILYKTQIIDNVKKK